MFGWFEEKEDGEDMVSKSYLLEQIATQGHRIASLDHKIASLEKHLKWQQEQITELKETLIDLIYHPGLEEDQGYEPRRHVFRKRNAKREK